MSENEIIDWERKGNVIRFYTGKNGKQTGDDWDDVPYECNAGKVYDKFIKGHVDMVVPFEQTVFEPSDGHINSQWCKKDMIARKVPCIVVANDDEYGKLDSFEIALANDKSKNFFFGDKI